MAEAAPGTSLAPGKIFVIHVRTATDRAASIEAQLGGLGLHFEYILEGDRDELTSADINTWFRGRMSAATAETSCAFKHLVACDRLVDQGHAGALILEDDIFLAPGFVEKLATSVAELRTRPDAHPDIAFISLENTGLEAVAAPPVGETLLPADHGRAAGAYWLSRGAAENLLSRAQSDRLHEPIDHFHNTLVRLGLIEMWWRHPAIAEQGSHNGKFNSMLDQGRNSPLRRLRWLARKWWQELRS